MSNLQNKEARDKFFFLAYQLADTFPDLDLRFNMRVDSSLVRYKVASVSSETIEVDILEKGIHDLLYDAIFQIKEMAKLYDD